MNVGTAGAGLLETYTDLSQQLAAQAQVRDTAKAQVERLRAEPVVPFELGPATDAYVAAITTFDTLEAQQKAAGEAYQSAVENNAQSYKLVVVNPAADSFDTANSLIQRGGLVGAVLGFLVALVAATVLSRRPGRPATATDAGAGPDGAVDEHDPEAGSERALVPGLDRSSAR